MRAIALAALVLAAACASPKAVAPLASARMVSDFGSYELRRIGLMPPVGTRLTEQQQDDIQAACLAEFSAGSAIEIVRLTALDLEAIPSLEPRSRAAIASTGS